MKRHKTVEAYLEDLTSFRCEVERLREILGRTELLEEVKWGAPIYTHKGKNVVGLVAFKEHFALWFHQGVLLKDEAGVLINAGEGKTKALRQWRFTSAGQIKSRQIQAYVKEAILHVEAGKEIKPTRGKPVVLPAELAAAFGANATLAEAFNALTPGKQREYAAHIQEAKRDATKAQRIAKIVPMIERGAGLHDKYRRA